MKMSRTLFILKDHAKSVYYMLFTLLAGLCLLIFPQMTTAVVFWGLAGALMLIGLVQLIGYFRSDVQGAISGDKMATGLLLIVLGLIIGLAQETIASLLPVVFGFVLFVGGIFKTQGAFDLRRMGDARWFMALVGALISLVCGVIILVDPFDTLMTLMRVMGAFLVLESVQDMLYAWRYEKIRKNFVIH